MSKHILYTHAGAMPQHLAALEADAYPSNQQCTYSARAERFRDQLLDPHRKPNRQLLYLANDP